MFAILGFIYLRPVPDFRRALASAAVPPAHLLLPPRASLAPPAAPAGGRWFAAHIPVPATVDVASAPPLEFFITQGTSLPSVSGSSDSFELGACLLARFI